MRVWMRKGRSRILPGTTSPASDCRIRARRTSSRLFAGRTRLYPQALLLYNEAEGEGLNRKSDAVYAMVKDFKRRGVPIDGVGLQLHVSQLDLDTAAIAANIARLAALGVQVPITELDVSLPFESNSAPRSADLLRQAAVYRAVIRACLQSSGCTAI